MEPNQIAPNDAQIEDLVALFYARVREDAELGPIFERTIGADWGPHLKTMCDFWSSVMNTTGRYKGRPIPAHIKLTGIEPHHFERWLGLFANAVQELFEPALAQLFVLRAQRIAESLKLGLSFHAERPEIWGGIPRASFS